MISHEDYIAYFKDIAIRHVDLKHTDNTKAFHIIRMDELVGDTSGKFAKRCLILECESGNITGPSWEQLYDQPDMAFVIAEACKFEDRVKEEEILDHMKRIGFDILAKMKKDYKQKHALMKSVEPNSFQYQKVYGFGDNHFGWRFQFRIADNTSLVYNPDVWD